MLKVKGLVVGQMKANCFLVSDDGKKEAFILDPGDDADYIMRIILDENLNPKKIIATHGHFDHILAAYELQLAYNIPFLIHKKDEFLLNRVKSSAKHFLGIEADSPPKIDGYLTAFNPVSLGKYKFKVIETPGHSPGGVSLYNKEEKILFSGDLIFEGGAVGRTDFKYSSEIHLKESINKILKLDEDTLVYSGHGEPFYIRDFKKYFH